MKKSASLLVLLLFFSVVLVSFPQIEVVKADQKTIVVPDDYSTIQEAIDAASEGDTVYVESGIYLENLVIKKSISLIGENKETTTIYRRDQSYPDVYPTVVVRENRVNITGFTIKNDVSSPSQITSGAVESHSGVHLINVRDCNIFENIVVDSGYGIWLYGSYNNNVSDNKITNVNHGIFVDHSSDNTILGNTVSNCCTGIVLSSASLNVLRNNKMINNSRNFGVSGSELSHFINDVDVSNLINANKVYYFINKNNLVINPVLFPDLAALILVNCTDITVQNLNITHNYCGISLFSTSNCKVINSTFSHNTAGGLHLQFANNCVLSENILIENTEWEIRVKNSENIHIVRNNLTCLNSYGISILDSTNINVVENCVKESVNSLEGVHGVYLKKSNNNRILSNHLSVVYGFTFEYSSYNLLYSNVGSPVALAVCISDESRYNRIVGNNFTTERGSFGIELASSFNFIIGNNILNFSSGLEISNSINNTIIGNTINSRTRSFQFYNFSNSQIYRNNILGQTKVWDMGREIPNRPISVNQWDSGIDGNYWSNYEGTDANGDGIGEQSYIIDADNQDRFPIVAPIEMFDAGLWEWTSYNVGVVSNSSVSDFVFSPKGTIRFSVDGKTGTTGFCRVAIPKDLLDSEEDDWLVLVNDNPVTPTVHTDTECTILNFTYNHSTKTVEIIGTEAIPEFPSWIILSLFLMASLVAIIVKKRLSQHFIRTQNGKDRLKKTLPMGGE